MHETDIMLGEIVSGLSIWDRIVKFWKNRKSKTNETVAVRFVRLFENHGVHRNQIPRFFGHGLTIADVKNDEILLDKLSEEMLEEVCELFAVRREWLDGADSKIHPEQDFYKWPEKYQEFIDKLNQDKSSIDVQGVLIIPEESDWDAHALLILQETIGYVGDKPIYRFHLCNNWAYNNWKPRAYLTACIAMSWKHNNYIHAITKSRAFIEELAYGDTLLGWNGEGIWSLGHKSFDPEYMALQPEAFLKELRRDNDDSEIKAALKLWLDLNDRGFMDAGFGNHEQEFRKELEKYTVVNT